MRLIRLLKNELASEIEDWVGEGLLEQEQADGILQRYGITPGEKQSLAYHFLIGLGFFFIGLSVMTLIGANWDDIPRSVRMLGLVSLTALTHLLGIDQFNRGKKNRAIGIFFLGNLFYGASIVLISQIYHLGEHMPDGIYWWALGCLPFAVLLNSRLIAIQMLLLALVWLWVEGSLGFYPASFPVFIAAAIYVLVRGGASQVLFLTSMVSFFLWIQFSLSAFWQEGRALEVELEHLPIAVSMIASAYGLGHWLSHLRQEVFQDYGAVMGIWCLRFVVLLLIVLGFENIWVELIEANWSHGASMLVVSGFFWLLAMTSGWIAGQVMSLAAFMALFVVTLVSLMLTQQAAHALLFQVAYNLIIVGMGIWLIIRGVNAHISHYFYTGISLILFTALLRYFDLIGNYIGGALLFLAMAGVLLAAARYWRQFEEEQRS